MLRRIRGALALAATLAAFGAGAASALTVTFENTTSIRLPASGTSGNASLFPTTISVSGFAGTVTDVDVKMTDLEHKFSADLEIWLVGPDGTSVWLMRDQGGSADWNRNDVTFSDGGAALSVGNTGTYAPLEALSAFNARDPNGTWSLYVFDDAAQNTGRLRGGWSLSITYDPPVNADAVVPLPATLPLLGGAFAIAGAYGRRPRRKG